MDISIGKQSSNKRIPGEDPGGSGRRARADVSGRERTPPAFNSAVSVVSSGESGTHRPHMTDSDDIVAEQPQPVPVRRAPQRDT